MQKKILSLLLVLFCFVSCKYDLLPEPTGTGSSAGGNSLNKKITAPLNLSASQGDYRSVTLTWDSVLNATQYQIFAADTEFDKFEKKGETKGSETTFTLPESTGSTKAFYVKAVDYYGNVSRASQIVTGSTISVPIITDITKNKDGDVYTINWWMSNCSEATYEDLITYVIYCYEDGVASPAKIELPGTENSYQFTNLKESTTYKFTIEAYKTGTKNKHEVSDIEPIETGHRIVPLPATDFTVTKGKGTKDINISFKLPPKIEVYNKKDAVYEKDNPIYFTLKRKLSTDPDTAYETVYSYIGSKTDSESQYSKAAPAGKKYKFDSYEQGKTINLTDTLSEANRGKKYDYILQSYTDYNGSNTTSDKTAVVVDTGWTISPASFKTSDTIHFDDNDSKKISAINVDLQVYFNPLDLPYTYVLTSHKYDINSESTSVEDETVIKYCNSISELNSYSINFSDTENQKGYYEYKLYIIEQSDSVSSVPSSYLDCISAPSKVTVIADATALPEITYNGQQNFNVEDGYKDHYIISWDSLGDDCSYVLSWVNKVGDSYTDSKSTVSFTEKSYADAQDTATKISVSGGKVILNHSATSGEVRSYTLTATKGLSKSCTNTNDYYTLGTAAPEMKVPDYKSITVSWEPVQKAKTDINQAYTISAKYKGESTELLKADNYSLEEVDGKIVCVITKPAGYSDATKSGKPIEFKVTAKSDVDQTTGSEEVYTLGPANLDVHTDEDIYTDHINIFWNKVEGAAGYLVYRTVMNTSLKMENVGAVLYVTEDGVYEDGSIVSSSKVTVKGQVISFTDNYEYCSTEDAQQSTTKNQQRRISWGLPFGYTVLPVLSENDVSFDIDTAKNKVTTSVGVKTDKETMFANKTQTVGSTFGYGLNVKATKAVSSKEVTITWDQPYITESTVSQFFPKLYKKAVSETKWSAVETPTATTAASIEKKLTYQDNDTSVYEYAVVYNNSTFDKSYIDYLNSTLDKDNSPTEQLNIGYTMSIPNGNISAQSNSEYKEQFDWTDSTYNFEQRSIGPDYYEIQMLNKNKVSGWTTVATIPIESKTNNNGTKATSDNRDSTKVKLVSSSTYQAVFEPVFDSNNLTYGQMQVLRDYKHYYRLVAVKMTDDNRENAIVSVADMHKDVSNNMYEAFAYRNITDEELMRCISLIIADAINQAGINDGGDAAYTKGSTGKFTINHPGASKTIKWGTEGSDYQHLFKSGLPYDYNINKNNSNYKPEAYESPFIISLAEVESRRCADGNKLYCLPEGTITIKNNLNNSSYGLKSKLTFKMGERGHEGWTVLSDGVSTSWTVTITYNSKTLSVASDSSQKETDYKNIFPFDIGGNHKNQITTYSSSIPEYQAPWWETTN